MGGVIIIIFGSYDVGLWNIENARYWRLIGISVSLGYASSGIFCLVMLKENMKVSNSVWGDGIIMVVMTLIIGIVEVVIVFFGLVMLIFVFSY